MSEPSAHTQKHIVLGVTGSIAAYKAADIASQLAKAGHQLDVVMTREALHFIEPLTFAAITHRPVTTDLWDEQQPERPTHIQLADQADLILIAPATAHLIAQMAHGLAGDALTSLLLAVPTHVPILVAPAMNGKMWTHPATQANVQTLLSRGIEFIGPESGLLACGYVGTGRLWPTAEIVDRAETLLASSKKWIA